MIDNRTVGKTIATLRQARGMTQQQLAAVMNVSHQAVSKWENGAALPDIQTLVELTQLFGITIEQLLNGEIPEERLNNAPTFDDHIQNIGNFVNGVIDDIGGLFKPGERETSPENESESAADSEKKENADDDEDRPEAADKIDLQKLLQMAPFMSRSTLQEMLAACRRKLSAAEISRFAPFLDSGFLENLLRKNGTEINWETLRNLAPFLKKEVVDAFARTIALGEKAAQPVAQEACRAADNVCKTLDDVSQKIGRGMDKAVRKVVKLGENMANEVSRAFDDLTSECPSRDERLARLRSSAFDRAMEDGRWDWIEAHLSEVRDEALKRRISERANSLGMREWVCKNLGGYADVRTIEEAVEEGNWSWLSDHVQEFDAAMQQRVALAAAKAENWQWLSTCAERMQLEECVVEIASCARRAGARMLAVQLARYDMRSEQVEQMALEAIGAADFEFIDMILDLLSSEALNRCCIRMAKAGDWTNVKRYAEKLEPQGVEWLMEVAIEAGNFDAIDMLDEMLKTDNAEGEEK